MKFKYIANGLASFPLIFSTSILANTFDYDKKNLLVGDKHTLTWNMPSFNRCVNNSGKNMGTNGSWTVRRNSAGARSSTIICYERNSNIGNKFTATYSVFNKQELINNIDDKIKNVGNVYTWLGAANGSIGYSKQGNSYSFNDTYSDKIGLTLKGYNSAMWVDGLISLYHSTGNKEYAEIAINLVKNYLDSGVSLCTDKDPDNSSCEEPDSGYLDWYSSDSKGLDHWHYEYRAAYGLARVLSSLHDDEQFFGDSRLATIKSFLINDFVKKWEERITGDTVTHMLSRAGLVYLYLYDVTGDVKYKTEATTLANKLKASLDKDDDKNVNGHRIQIISCYLDGRECPNKSDTLKAYNSIDVSHANDTLHFILESYQRGIAFKKSNIDLLISTLKYSILNEEGRYFRSNLYTKDSHPNDRYSNLGALQGVWAKLAEHDRELLFMYVKWLQIETQDNVYEGLKTPIYTDFHRNNSGSISPWTIQIMANLSLAIKNTAPE